MARRAGAGERARGSACIVSRPGPLGVADPHSKGVGTWLGHRHRRWCISAADCNQCDRARTEVCVCRRVAGSDQWLRGQDLNLGPSGYEPDELPGCSTPRWCPGARVRGVGGSGVGWKTWRRPTFPRLVAQYHGRWGFSRPSSGWDRVRAPRHGHQVIRPTRWLSGGGRFWCACVEALCAVRRGRPGRDVDDCCAWRAGPPDARARWGPGVISSLSGD